MIRVGARSALAVTMFATAACGGSAERWAAMEAEGMPGGPDDAPMQSFDDEGRTASLGPEGRDVDSLRSERPPPRAAGGPSARVEPRSDPEPPRRLDHGVLFVRWSAERVDASLLAEKVRAKRGGFVECARSAAVGSGFVTVELRYAKGATAPKVASSRELGGPLGPCLEQLLGDITLNVAAPGPAKLVVDVRLSEPSAVERPLPEIEANEQLDLVAGGGCVARERHQCKPPAACVGVSERDVRCPEDHGLVPASRVDTKPR